MGDSTPQSSKSDRKHTRFRVADCRELVATIDPQFEAVLVNVGEGGAGFYSTVCYQRLKVGNRVFSQFRLEGVTADPIDIQGRVAHITPVDLNGKVVTFYGVEFLTAHQTRIAPIIEALRSYAGSGKVVAY